MFLQVLMTNNVSSANFSHIQIIFKQNIESLSATFFNFQNAFSTVAFR